MSSIKTIDDIPINCKITTEYYCANIIERRFECSQRMLFVYPKTFSMNYKYCANCYYKWNNLGKKEQINPFAGKCLIDIKKL